MQGHLGAGDRAQAERLGRVRELERAVDAVVVGQRERRRSRARPPATASSSGSEAPSRNEYAEWQWSSTYARHATSVLRHESDSHACASRRYARKRVVGRGAPERSTPCLCSPGARVPRSASSSTTSTCASPTWRRASASPAPRSRRSARARRRGRRVRRRLLRRRALRERRRRADERPHTSPSGADRETVQRFHEAAVAAGGRDNGAPGERPYHPGYYAAYVLDPDGNNIERLPRSGSRSAPSVVVDRQVSGLREASRR